MHPHHIQITLPYSVIIIYFTGINMNKFFESSLEKYTDESILLIYNQKWEWWIEMEVKVYTNFQYLTYVWC
jgi:hypothetical protein